MLATQYRVPRSVSFSNTKSKQTLFFRVLFKENQLSFNRFGFIVSKKIDKRAVGRNRLKRVLREAASHHLTARQGKDMLFIVKQTFIKEKTADIFSLVDSVLK